LTGELRQISGVELRLNEIARMGFKACILPYSTKGRVKASDNLELIHVKNILQAIDEALI